MNNKPEAIIVWGATSGVGTRLIKELCKGETAVIAYARQPQELADLSSSLSKLTVRPFEINEDFYRHELEYLRQKQYKIVGMADCVGSITVRDGATLTERLQDILTPNLYHQYLSTQVFAELFADNASIVYISSIRAKTGTDNANIEYAFSKAALENLTKSFVHMFKAKHIRINAIRPTPIQDTKLSAEWPQSMIDNLKAQSVYGELLTPNDIVPIILFLLSENSHAITGATLDVTNGFGI